MGIEVVVVVVVVFGNIVRFEGLEVGDVVNLVVVDVVVVFLVVFGVVVVVVVVVVVLIVGVAVVVVVVVLIVVVVVVADDGCFEVVPHKFGGKVSIVNPSSGLIWSVSALDPAKIIKKKSEKNIFILFLLRDTKTVNLVCGWWSFIICQ